MANIIHMETDTVRSAATQLEQTSLKIQQAIWALGRSVLALDWQSPAREQYVLEFRELERRMTACAEEGVTLAMSVKREVAEWEQGALQLEGGSLPFSNPMLIIGGGALVVIGGIVWWGSQNLEGLSAEEAEAKIEDILRRTPAGREAIAKAEELNIKIKPGTPGGGTYYDPNTDTMYIDPKTHPDLAAESYIHEMQHARQDAEGRLPDAGTLSRDEYVDRTVDIEAEALIKEYEYENERPALDYIHEEVGENAYQKAYRDTMNALKKSTPEMSAEEMHRLAYEAGKEEVKKLYRDGTIRASTNGQSYVDNARGFWDTVHAPQTPEKTM